MSVENIVKKLKESKSLSESSNNREYIVAQEINKAIQDAVKEVMTSASFGFSEDEYDEYSAVELVFRSERGVDYIVVEVRAEVSYEGLMELSDELNKIVTSYDKDAYFEPVTSGIIVCYINAEKAMKLSDVFSYEGPVYVFGKYKGDIKKETTAPSAAKAASNIIHQIGKDMNQQDSHIRIDRTLVKKSSPSNPSKKTEQSGEEKSAEQISMLDPKQD